MKMQIKIIPNYATLFEAKYANMRECKNLRKLCFQLNKMQNVQIDLTANESQSNSNSICRRHFFLSSVDYIFCLLCLPFLLTPLSFDIILYFTLVYFVVVPVTVLRAALI